MGLTARWFFTLLGILSGALWHDSSLAADKPSTTRVAAKQADFYVQVNQRKDSGHPWHGPGDLFVLGGKMVTHLPEAPGAVLCIVLPDGTASCPGQRGETAVAPKPAPEPASAPAPRKGPPPGLSKFMAKKPASPCPSAYSCEFENIALPSDDMFGVVVIDPAMALINLVDAVIVTRSYRTKKDADVVAFDEKLRAAVNQLAPPGPFESKRRLRKFEVRTLNECRKGCKFSQSEITIDPD
jgi:hypothetical protein